MAEQYRWIVGLFVLPAVLSGACNPKDVNKNTAVDLVSLSITPVDTSIAPGTTIQLKATGAYSNNTTRELTSLVTWESSDPATASVGDTAGTKGLVSAGAGTGAVIISAVEGSMIASTTLTLSAVASLAVTPSPPSSIAPETTQQFAATGTLEDGIQQDLTSWATWTSLDSAVAVVDDGTMKGLATAVNEGAAGIQASFAGFISLVTMTVSPVASIALSPPNAAIADGTSQQFEAAGTLADNSTQTLTTWATWTSSNTGVATVGNASGTKGLASAVGVGSTTISATFSSVVSSATLTVTDAALESIAVTPGSAAVAAGSTWQFTATGTYSDGSTQDITSSAAWSSSDSDVATISNAAGSEGLAAAVAEGSCTITATLSGKSYSAAFDVTAAQLKTITVSPASAGVVAGTAKQFTATGTYSDATTRNLTTSVTWSSSDPGIASINSAGTAVAGYTAGSTNIAATLWGITSNTATLTVSYY